MRDEQSDDEDFLPIPLDRETRLLLRRYSDETGVPPARAASALLRDLLRDDAEAHRCLN